MRYFFDREARLPVRDAAGKDFETFAKAKEHAQELALLLTSGPAAHRVTREAEIVVRDEAGEVFRVKVSTAQ